MPIPLQYWVESLTISLSPQCEGTLYLIPDSDVIAHVRNVTSLTRPTVIDYLYLVSNCHPHLCQWSTYAVGRQ